MMHADGLTRRFKKLVLQRGSFIVKLLMKKVGLIDVKRILKRLLLVIVISVFMTGCFKRDDLEGVDVYTTVYPVQYVTEQLYGYNSNVKSIYPAEENPDQYTLNDKQIEEYSKGAIFVYNGLSNEKGFARDLLNKNKKLKIIDVSQGLEYSHSVEELWLNPRDYLMLAHNIKNGLEEYINNKYIIEEINKNYENLKVLISSYDAELETAPDNAKDKNILIASDTLSFLSKYGFVVTNVDESNGEISSTVKQKAKKLVGDKTVKYVYMLDNQEESNFVKELLNAGATKKILRSMTVLTEEDIRNGATYKTMMRDNIEELKKEIYDVA